MFITIVGLSIFVLVFGLISYRIAAEYRLEKHIVPVSYNITIKPYLLAEPAKRQFTFDGQVNITLRALEHNVRRITLHADNIQLAGTWLFNATEMLVQEITDHELEYEEITNKLTIKLQQALEFNVDYVLRFNYTGSIGSNLTGFFRTRYIEPYANGKNESYSSWFGVTQMQRINARAVFPCFDEPAFKAKFQLHISRPKSYTTVTNTRLMYSEKDGDEWYLDHFETTPVMSTYLLAFIMAEEQKVRGNADVAVITRAEHYNNTEFSYNVALRVVDAYSDTFKIPYKELGNPLLQYAVSPESPHNGMENWGLIICTEDVLVKEPGYTDSYHDKEYTIRIIAHETSHMWFGNSVTFVWWSYFWLNEAFARYFEYFMAHQLYPEYQLDQQFVVDQIHLIFSNDAVAGTQPLTSAEASIQRPSEIAWKFNGIAYAKGAAILRMIRNAMGGDNFDEALREYLTQHHLRNTAPYELFFQFKKHWPSNKRQQVDLDQFFYDWTEQVGYPLVIVNASSDRTCITLTQTRFLLKRNDGSDPYIRYTIPISYATNKAPNFTNATPCVYFNKSSDKLMITFAEPIVWIVLNLQQMNYHRVFYDRPLLRALQAALAAPGHSGIPVENRAQIIDDLFNSADVDLIDYADVMQFIEYLAQETEYLPWHAAFEGLQRIAQRLPTEQLSNFAQFLYDLTAKVYGKLGFKCNAATDTVLDVYNRKNLIAWLCKYQHKDCNAQARAALREMSEMGIQKYPTDLRETIYCSAVRAGESIYKLLAAETHKIERWKMWYALAWSKDYKTFFEQQIFAAPSDILVQHMITAIGKLYEENPENVTPIFLLINAQITQLTKNLGAWSITADVIYNIAKYFTTNEQQQMLQNFVAQKGSLFGDSLPKLQMALKIVAANLNWAELRLSGTIYYLQKRRNSTIASRQIF